MIPIKSEFQWEGSSWAQSSALRSDLRPADPCHPGPGLSNFAKLAKSAAAEASRYFGQMLMLKNTTSVKKSCNPDIFGYVWDILTNDVYPISVSLCILVPLVNLAFSS